MPSKIFFQPAFILYRKVLYKTFRYIISLSVLGIIVMISGCDRCEEKLLVLTSSEDQVYASIDSDELNWEGILLSNDTVLPPSGKPYDFVIKINNEDMPLINQGNSKDEISKLVGQQVKLLGKLQYPRDEGLSGPEEMIFVRTIETFCGKR